MNHNVVGLNMAKNIFHYLLPSGKWEVDQRKFKKASIFQSRNAKSLLKQ
jgi:hypothetical protein